MADAKFTPGPHSVVPAEHLGDTAYAVQASDGDLIAVGCLKADATLFSAAPELFEALEKALRGFVGTPETRAELHAVLAKARGDQ